MEEKRMTEQESLQLINEMIYKAKNHFHESGASALLWGSTIIFCSIVSLVNSYWRIKWLESVWWLTFAAIIPQIIISIREAKQRKYKAHTDDAMGGIWISFGIAVFLVSYYTNEFKPAGSASLFLILYGMPTLATGLAHRFKPMIIGGIVCWVCAIISFYTPLRTDLILFIIAAFFAWFLPGAILRRHYLKARRKHV
jgi:hypothetical protein